MLDDRIERLRTPKDCEIFARNAAERDRPDLAQQAIQKAVRLRADQHDASTPAEIEALEAIYAYEETLRRKSGKNTRASRTWQMIKRRGIIAAVEQAVNRAQETEDYTALAEAGLQEFAFEAVVLRHPDMFSHEAVDISRARMSAWTEQS